MYSHICTCIHIYINTLYIQVNMYIYTHICIYLDKSILCRYIYVCIYMYVYMYLYDIFIIYGLRAVATCRIPQTCCNTLQRTTRHGNLLRHTASLAATHYHTPERTAANCNTLHTHCSIIMQVFFRGCASEFVDGVCSATHCNTLQHTATHIAA